MRRNTKIWIVVKLSYTTIYLKNHTTKGSHPESIARQIRFSLQLRLLERPVCCVHTETQLYEYMIIQCNVSIIPKNQ